MKYLSNLGNASFFVCSSRFGEIIYQWWKFSQIFNQKIERSHFFTFFPKEIKFVHEKMIFELFHFFFFWRYITCFLLNFHQNCIFGHFWKKITKINQNWAKMTLIHLDSAKNIWNFYLKQKTALISIKKGIFKGVAKRTPLVNKH